MWDIFTIVFENINMDFTSTLCLVVGIGGLIFYAGDFKRGIIMHFIMYGLLFMYIYFLNENFALPLTLFLIFLVLMTFTLYSSVRVGQAGGIQ